MILVGFHETRIYQAVVPKNYCNSGLSFGKKLERVWDDAVVVFDQLHFFVKTTLKRRRQCPRTSPARPCYKRRCVEVNLQKHSPLQQLVSTNFLNTIAISRRPIFRSFSCNFSQFPTMSSARWTTAFLLPMLWAPATAMLPTWGSSWGAWQLRDPTTWAPATATPPRPLAGPQLPPATPQIRSAPSGGAFLAPTPATQLVHQWHTVARSPGTAAPPQYARFLPPGEVARPVISPPQWQAVAAPPPPSGPPVLLPLQSKNVEKLVKDLEEGCQALGIYDVSLFGDSGMGSSLIPRLVRAEGWTG